MNTWTDYVIHLMSVSPKGRQIQFTQSPPFHFKESAIMNTDNIKFPPVIFPEQFSQEVDLPLTSHDQISPAPGEQYFKVIVSSNGEIIDALNITSTIRELKRKFYDTEGLTDFINTRF